MPVMLHPYLLRTQALLVRPGMALARRVLGSVLAIIVVSCLAWTLMQCLSAPALDNRHDMLENYAWSQLATWGTHKHPPFFAWMVGLWFAWVPHQSSYYKLFAYLNVALALWGVVKLADALNLDELGKPAVILLLWSFPYTTLAAKFNANAQLLSLWPWTAFVLLRSWQSALGSRQLTHALILGALGAACILSKYFSGVFLLGLWAACLLHPQGRRWLRTPWPYVALALMGALLWPHLQWVLAHEGVTFKYVQEQGDGHIYYKGWLTFALSPILYWLPAWLVVLGFGGLALCRAQADVPRWRVLLRWACQSWQSQGRDDTLFALAFVPWAVSLMFGLSTFVNLSTAWAIPIGYAFPLLWLRNFKLQARLHQIASPWAKLDACVYPVLAALLLVAGLWSWRNAQNSDVNYYKPAASVASAMLNDWQQRHPTTPLVWVGGDWAENAVVSFYGRSKLVVIPGLPGAEPATVYDTGDLSQQPGLIFCSLGPVQVQHQAASACELQARAWLHDRGLPVESISYKISRKGWRFPAQLEFEYLAFHIAQP